MGIDHIRSLVLWVSLLATAPVSAVFAQQILVDGSTYSNLSTAFRQAKNGSLILLRAGVYQQAGVLSADNVTIRGEAGVVIRSKAINGKAAMVIKGRNITIENIECYDIQVADENGACVRFQGTNLVLDNVYFHDAETGLLTGRNAGRVLIKNSKFERLGKKGQAHGIYVGGGELYIYKSQFLAGKSEGMEVKSRARKTVVEKSVIASLDGYDSRLLDIPNGGELIVKDSLLQQGNRTSNWNLIGFGLEGYKHQVNKIQLLGNIILLERKAANKLLHIKNDKIRPTVSQNMIIGKAVDQDYPDNFWFKDRQAAGIPVMPILPDVIDSLLL